MEMNCNSIPIFLPFFSGFSILSWLLYAKFNYKFSMIISPTFFWGDAQQTRLLKNGRNFPSRGGMYYVHRKKMLDVSLLCHWRYDARLQYVSPMALASRLKQSWNNGDDFGSWGRDDEAEHSAGKVGSQPHQACAWRRSFLRTEFVVIALWTAGYCCVKKVLSTNFSSIRATLISFFQVICSPWKKFKLFKDSTTDCKSW